MKIELKKSREHLTGRMNQTENRPLGLKGKVEHLGKVHELFITEDHKKLIKHTGNKHIGNMQHHEKTKFSHIRNR